MDETQVQDATVTTDFYSGDDTAPLEDNPDVEAVSWTASEFLHHQKSIFWYLLILLSVVALSGLAYLLTEDIFGPAAVLVLGILLMVGASRKPTTQNYLVDESGITIGKRAYAYDDFQSFSILQEDNIESIALFPHRRFSPLITVYFSPDDGEKIFNVISKFLPFEDRDKDPLDRFLHKIRF